MSALLGRANAKHCINNEIHIVCEQVAATHDQVGATHERSWLALKWEKC
jgi:hypothetical protein